MRRISYIFEDALLINKMKEVGKMSNFKDPLIKYRLMPNSASTKSGREASFINKLCHEIIVENNLSKSNQEILDGIKRNSNPNEMQRLYHLHLAKKYLWNNYAPKKARKNLITAIKIRPYIILTYLLILVSFLPEKLVVKIYKALN
jgi:hypothetical protein